MFILKPLDIIRDPVHHYIELTGIEKELIDSPEFQRLRYIKQLPGAFYVYPGATHTRFEHSLGTMHLAGEIAETLLRSEWKNSDKEEKAEIEKQIQKIRIAALLHDIGHGPFSHVFEFMAFEGFNHEDFGREISQSLLRRTILNGAQRRKTTESAESYGFEEKDIDDICKWAFEKYSGEKDKYPFEIVADRENKLDADKFDYLLRDAYYTGTVEYGVADIRRLIINSALAEVKKGCRQRCFNLRVKLALSDIWLARYEMFSAVYYHRTARSAELLLAQILKALDEELDISDVIKHKKVREFLKLTDDILNYARRLPESNRARKLVEKLDKRELYKPVEERKFVERDAYKIISLKEYKRREEEAIAEIAGVSPDCIMLDTPHVDVPFYPGAYSTVYFVNDEGEPMPIPPEELLPFRTEGRIELTLRIYTTEPEVADKVRKAFLAWLQEKGLESSEPFSGRSI